MLRAPIPPGRWRPPTDLLGPEPTLPALWRTRWQAHPSASVLVDGSNTAHVVSADALAARTARIAAALGARGIGPGDRVLWSASASIPAIEAIVAVLRMGAVLVTVNPSATASETAHVVTDCTPSLVLTDVPGADRFPSSVTVLSFDHLAAEAARAAHEPDDHVPVLDPSSDALVVYTSGTTGTPKGAVHTHASLFAGATCIVGAWGWQPEDRLTLCLPLFHVHGLCAGLFGTLTAGASATVFDRFSEDAVLAATERDDTMFFGVPTMYHRLAATGRAGDLRALRLCVSGSAPLAADLWHQLDAAGVPVLERYGMTETLLTLSNPLEGERRPGSVGMPLPGVEAAIDEPDHDGVGELLVRGPSLCRGYWGRPGSPFGPEGWFPTGDLVSVADDGYVTIRGRRTELIITGGHNVYPAEVEGVLARHPGVVEVAVVGLPDAEWGETVVAFVVGDPDLDSLRAHAAAELAPFKCPRDVRLVDALPRNALGKVVRSALR